MSKLLYAGTTDADMFYKVRKDIHDPFLYIEHKGQEYIVLNVLEYDAYLTYPEKNEALEVLSLEDYQGAKMLDIIYDVCKKIGVTDAQVANSFPISLYEGLKEKGVSLQVEKVFFPERWIKTKQEIEAIQESINHTEAAFDLIKEILEASHIRGDEVIYDGNVLTSEVLLQEVEMMLFDSGMIASEGLIISSGLHAAMPHHRGTGPIVPNTFIICDIFPRSRKTGYFADITRTFCKGEPSEEMVKMYSAVKRAQEASMNMLAPGVKGSDVYKKTCEVITSSGFSVGKDGFNHGTGHSFGLEIHEAPTLSKRCDEKMKEGMIQTVEPGLYYMDRKLGVRIEDDVVITSSGYKCLSTFDKDHWVID